MRWRLEEPSAIPLPYDDVTRRTVGTRTIYARGINESCELWTLIGSFRS